MKIKAWSPAINLILLSITMSLSTGCQSFRWGKRSIQELDEANKVKERESRYWRTLKPDRSLQDPLWTP